MLSRRGFFSKEAGMRLCVGLGVGTMGMLKAVLSEFLGAYMTHDSSAENEKLQIGILPPAFVLYFVGGLLERVIRSCYFSADVSKKQVAFFLFASLAVDVISGSVGAHGFLLLLKMSDVDWIDSFSESIGKLALNTLIGGVIIYSGAAVLALCCYLIHRCCNKCLDRFERKEEGHYMQLQLH